MFWQKGVLRNSQVQCDFTLMRIFAAAVLISLLISPSLCDGLLVHVANDGNPSLHNYITTGTTTGSCGKLENVSCVLSQMLLDEIPEGITILLSSGLYSVNQELYLTKSISIIGNRDSSPILQCTSTANRIFHVNGTRPEYNAICSANDRIHINITMKNLVLQGCKPQDNWGGGGVLLFGVSWALFEHMKFVGHSLVSESNSMKVFESCFDRFGFSESNPLFQAPFAASSSGGAIEAFQSEILMVNDSVFMNNRARNGGAIWASLVNQVYITNCSFTGNAAFEAVLSLSDNLPLVAGGAIYVWAGSYPSFLSYEQGVWQQAPFYDDVSALGIHDYRSSSNLTQMGLISFSRLQFTDNSAAMTTQGEPMTGVMTSTGSISGGAVEVSFSASSHFDFHSNYKPNFTCSFCNFKGNSVSMSGITSCAPKGGALRIASPLIHVVKTMIQISDCTFSGNSAKLQYPIPFNNKKDYSSGGGAVSIYAVEETHVLVKNSVFERNSIEFGDRKMSGLPLTGKNFVASGGALEILNGHMTYQNVRMSFIITGCTFDRNHVTVYYADTGIALGGACSFPQNIGVEASLSKHSSTTLKILKSKFTYNQAQLYHCISGKVTGGHIAVSSSYNHFSSRTKSNFQNLDFEISDCYMRNGMTKSDVVHPNVMHSSGGIVEFSTGRVNYVRNLNMLYRNITSEISVAGVFLVPNIIGHLFEKAKVKYNGFISSAGGGFSFTLSGIDEISGINITIDGCSISESCTSAIGGNTDTGACVAKGGAISLNMTTFEGRLFNNSFTVSNTIIEKPCAEARGGAYVGLGNGGAINVNFETILSQFVNKLEVVNSEDLNVLIKAVRVHHASTRADKSIAAAAAGGGMHFSYLFGRISTSIEDSTFENCRVVCNSEQTSATAVGSAISFETNDVQSLDYSLMRFMELFPKSNVTVRFIRNVFKSNYFDDQSNNGAGTVAIHALLSFNTTYIFDSCIFDSNRASTDAGLAIRLDGYFNPVIDIRNSVFKSNEANSYACGALRLILGPLDVQYGYASQLVNFLYSVGQVEPVLLQNCQFLHNRAYSSGGALSLDNVKVIMNSVLVRNNSVNGMGGGFDCLGSTLHTFDTILEDNYAAKAQVAVLTDSEWATGRNTVLQMDKDLVGMWLHDSKLIPLTEYNKLVSISSGGDSMLLKSGLFVGNVHNVFDCPIGSPLKIENFEMNSSEISCATCEDGFYAVDSKAVKCHKCNELGLYCRGGANVYTLYGYMALLNKTDESVTPFLAPSKFGCSLSECMWNDSCSGNHTNVPYCSGCAEGTTMAFGSKSCIPVSHCGDSLAYLLVCGIVMLCIVFVFVQVRLSKSRVTRCLMDGPEPDLVQSSIIKSAIYFLQTIDLVTPVHLTNQLYQFIGSIFNVSIDSAATGTSGICVFPMSGSTKVLLDYFIPLIIMIGWIVFYSAHVIVLACRERGYSFGGKKTEVELDRLDGEMPNSKHSNMVALSAGLLDNEADEQPNLTNQLISHSKYTDKQQELVVEKTTNMRSIQYVIALWSIALFIYSQLTKTTLRLLDCRMAMNGNLVMFWDGAIECWGKSVNQVIGICVFPLTIIFPIFLGYRTYKSVKAYRRMAMDSHVERGTSTVINHYISDTADNDIAVRTVLWNHYTYDCWYWESVMILRRLLLILLTFAIVDTRYPWRESVLFLCCVFIALAHGSLQPFRSRWSNTIESYNLWTLVVISAFNLLDGAYILLGRSVLEFEYVFELFGYKIGIVEFLMVLAVVIVIMEILVSGLTMVLQSHQTGKVWTNLNRSCFVFLNWTGRVHEKWTKFSVFKNLDVSGGISRDDWSSWKNDDRLDPILEE